VYKGFFCKLAKHIETLYATHTPVSIPANFMTVVRIEPTKDYPVPYDTTEEKTDTLLEEMAVAGNTAELQVELGAALDVSEGDAEREKELLQAVASAKKPSNLKEPATAFAAAAFLRTYGSQLAMDAAQARAAITNKLMELADCGDPRYELKALELLGKHSDIGIFTERSEITVNYKDPDDLEKAIKERVKRLLNATVVDITPLEESLDEELGEADVPELPKPLDEGLFEEVEEEDEPD
jgi:DNA polymerase III delta prime subunit